MAYSPQDIGSIYIIGNGFDLSLDGRTSYESFFTCLKYAFNAKKKEDFITTYLFEDNKNEVDLFYDILKNNIDNFFINCFINYNVVFDSWVAFETELEKIIVAFDNLITCLKTPGELFMDFGGNYVDTYLRHIFDFENLLSVLNIYPSNKYFTAYTDYRSIISNNNKGMLFFLKNCKYENGHDVMNGIEKFAHIFPKQLFDDLGIFSKLFELYLKIVEHYIKYHSCLKNVNKNTRFLNYNFTNYLENSIKNVASDGSILYLNGKIDDRFDKNKRVIFGINSDITLKNKEFSIFSKNVQRLLNGIRINYLKNLLENTISNIYVFGHSLSIADYDVLNYVFCFDYHRIKPKITIYYYDETSKVDIALNLKIILADSFDEFQKSGRIIFEKASNAFE